MPESKNHTCCKKIYFLALTVMIGCQTWYNFMGARELGGKYLDLESILYYIGSLIPAIFLGVNACKLVFAKDDHEALHWANRKCYKWIARFYLTILVGMIGFRLFARF